MQSFRPKTGWQFRPIGKHGIKILFLDIDGVVNNASTSFKTDLWPLDRFAAFLVGRIVLETDCKVVLSSSWRNHPEGVRLVEKHIVPLLDKTESFSNFRGKEIQKWLDKHPEVSKYAILDDDEDMLPEQQFSLFQTTWEKGLTEEIANEVIKHLNS